MLGRAWIPDTDRCAGDVRVGSPAAARGRRTIASSIGQKLPVIPHLIAKSLYLARSVPGFFASVVAGLGVSGAVQPASS